MGVGSSGGADVGVGSGGRGVAVGGGEVGRAVGGAGVALGRAVAAWVGGTDVAPGLGLTVGVRVAVTKMFGNPAAGVRAMPVGVCSICSLVCVASRRISGVSDRTAARILLLKNSCGGVYAPQRPGPVSPSLYAWMSLASSNALA